MYVVRSESRKYKKNDEKKDEEKDKNMSRESDKRQTKKHCDEKTAAKDKIKKKMIKGVRPVWMRPSIASRVLVWLCVFGFGVCGGGGCVVGPSRDLVALNISPPGSRSYLLPAVPWAPSAQRAALPRVPSPQGNSTEPCLHENFVSVGLPTVLVQHPHMCFVGLPTRRSECEPEELERAFLLVCEALSGHDAGYILLCANVLLGVLWIWASLPDPVSAKVPHDAQGSVKVVRGYPYLKLRNQLLRRRRLRQRHRTRGRPDLPPPVKPLCFQCRRAGSSRVQRARCSRRRRAAESCWRRLSAWSRGRGLGASFSSGRVRCGRGFKGRRVFLYARPRPEGNAGELVCLQVACSKPPGTVHRPVFWTGGGGRRSRHQKTTPRAVHPRWIAKTSCRFGPSRRLKPCANAGPQSYGTCLRSCALS